MNQEDQFQVPDDYFNKLEGRIAAQTSESVLERFRSVLTDMDALFRVPAYYFPRAQAALLNRLEEGRQALLAWSWQDALRPALIGTMALVVSVFTFRQPGIDVDQQIARIPQTEIESYLIDNNSFIPEDQLAFDGLFQPTSADSTLLYDSDLLDNVSDDIL